MSEIELNAKIDSLEKQVKALTEANENVLKVLYDNRASLGLAVKMRKKGSGNPRYIQGLNTADIIKDYIKNDYHITNEMKEKYKKEHNISYHGLRLRLIEAGMWKEKDKTVNS